jgi:hypothetical protein
MRTQRLIFLAMSGCTAGVEDTGFLPEDWPDVPQVLDPEILLEGLSSPMGLALCGDQVCVAEYGAGRVVEESGAIYADGFEGPWGLASAGSGLVLTDRDGGVVYAVSLESSQSLAEGLDEPMAVDADDTRACWTEGTTAQTRIGCGAFDFGVATVVVEDIPGPIRLALDGSQLIYGTGANSGSIHRVNLESGEVELLSSFNGPVKDVLLHQEAIYYTQQQVNWPSGGWVGRVEEGAGVELSYSPPEPALLVATEDWLIWSSLQSISAVAIGGGDYHILADQTAVGGMLVVDGDLYWSDQKSGRLLRLGL